MKGTCPNPLCAKPIEIEGITAKCEHCNLYMDADDKETIQAVCKVEPKGL